MSVQLNCTPDLTPRHKYEDIVAEGLADKILALNLVTMCYIIIAVIISDADNIQFDGERQENQKFILYNA